ncbi:MAG: hypothetical protein IT282_04925, partial [Bacteroidetes bacterium]|nr:hypothetical protein [Bacteroidota bacterium]
MSLQRLSISAILLLLFAGVTVWAAPKLTIGRSPQREISILVDPSFHARYGLTYPVTYRIGIPSGSRNLSAQTRYDLAAGWESLTEKTSEDFFNGIAAVRFDYEANTAYTSVRFDGNSDLVMIRILDDAGRPVAISYQGVCKYYDNRTAAVAISLDDWKTYTLPDFRRAFSLMRSFNLPMTVGVITGDVEDEATWAEMQSEINTGDIEPAGHTRTHPRWPNYGDVVSEVAGC